jgi:ATP-dependent DNA ligase|tara:strand:- start:3766 stop:4629 length:864 start_codon:yes stop_codon:yes gene_type:complete
MIKPMLAHKVNDKKIDFNEPVFIQPKLDGVRCLIRREFDDTVNADVIRAYSRTGKEFKNLKHILESLRDFFSVNPDVVLDGELYNHALRDDFEQIISLVRKQKPTDEDRRNAQHLIQYHVYDCIVPFIGYEARLNWLKSNKDLWSNVVIPVETYLVNKYEEAANMHYDGFLKQGYEGSILRLNGAYEQKRSYNLQKFKDFSDDEATIVGYEAGKGKRTGTLGKFFMMDDNGIEFGCPPGKGFNYKDLANILDNVHDYIGKRATFTYFERTKAGNYRHPQFKCIRDYE